MLDTVLKIGKALRESDDNLQYFKYVKPCPPDTERETILRLNIPVKEDFSFDWDNVSIITDENEIKKLYYLTFKSSGNDNSIKFLFGDIFFGQYTTISKTGKISINETGNYWLTKNSFELCTKDYNKWKTEQEISYLILTINKSDKDLLKTEIEKVKREYSKWKNKTEKKEKYIPIKMFLPYFEYLTVLFKKSLAYDEISFITKFRKRFNEQKENFENILSNISALKSFFDLKAENNILDFLSSNDVKDFHIKSILVSKNDADIKKFLKKENIEELSENDKDKLLSIKEGKLFIHFDFNQIHWYEKKEFENTKQKIYSSFFEENTNSEYLPSATLYKTLCSGRENNDMQFPKFSNLNKRKSRAFTKNEVEDLFYGVKFTSKACMTLGRNKKRNIKIIVLPNGDNLNEKDYLLFQKNYNENTISLANSTPQGDSIENEFVPFIGYHSSSNNNGDINFDVIFTETGGKTEKDLVELSGIKQSYFKKNQKRIRTKRIEVQQKYSFDYKIGISFSFLKILGNYQSKTDRKNKVSFKKEVNPKYQSHLIKVLPKIYTNQYYNDLILLPAFIEKVEYTIRQGNSLFYQLKYDFEFLLKIQNTKNNKYMELTESNSFKIGALLGSLAKNFSGKNTPINSFEKNYVGNLSRRIGTLEDFVKLKNDIEQKLVMHEKTQFTFSISHELSQMLKDFKGRYDKEACAFGFFDSYFKPVKKQTFFEKLEKIIGQNIDPDINKEMLDELKSVIDKYSETDNN